MTNPPVIARARKDKWKLIQNADAGKPKPHDVICCPTTGRDHFCQVPGIDIPNGPNFPAGNVVLFHGRRTGDKGYGVEHAWHRHFQKAKTLEDATVQIAAFVSLVLVAGTQIYYEYDPERPHRLTTIKSVYGVVVLEHRQDSRRGDFYSVVTAIPGKTQTKGSLVGALV